MALAFGIVVGILLGVTGAMWQRGSAPASGATSAGTLHVSLRLPAGELVRYDSLAISPDGQRVVYVTASGKPKLFVRDLASPATREIAGTDGAEYPFFSANGQWVGFIAQNKLKKVSIGGGSVDTLATVGSVRGAAWSEDDYIYFAISNVSGLSRISASGGQPVEVTHLDAASGEISHRNPQVLPGGKAILFTIWKGPGPDEKFVAVQPTAGGPHRILIRGGADGRYIPPGYLAYARGDRLFAVPFDMAALDVAKSAPVQMDQRIIGESTEVAAFAVSPTGALAYLPATPSRLERRIVWQDANGAVQPLPLPRHNYEQVKLSPDGKSAIVQLVDGAVGLSRLDLAQGTLTPLVNSGGSSQAPVWTPDGRRIIYRATRNGVRQLYWKFADGTGEEERLTTKPGMMHTPTSVSPDGEWVLFTEVGPQSDRGSYRLHLTGAKEIVPLPSATGEGNPQVSPNGKWIAVEGVPGPEIYVRAYGEAGPRIQVSRNGGLEPAWSHDGTKLYFERDGQLWVADVTTGAAFSAGVPRKLFDNGFLGSPNSVTGYSISKDGRVLRVEQAAPEPPADTINLVLNWGAELARLVSRNPRLPGS